jgi:hypothetical protein
MVVNDPLPEVEITPSSSSATSTTNSEATAVVVATPAIGELIGSTALRIGGGLLSLLFLTGDKDSHQRANVQQSQQATTVSASPNPKNDGDKQKKGRPQNNTDQNKQVRDAAKDEKLTPQQTRDLGRAVEDESRGYGRNLDYHDIRAIAKEIKSGNYH